MNSKITINNSFILNDSNAKNLFKPSYWKQLKVEAAITLIFVAMEK